MSNFITQLFDFLKSILTNMYYITESNGFVPLDINRQDYINFLDKQILNGELLSINMTFKEFFIYFGTLFLVAFFIVLVVKIILKFISIFRI